MPPDSRVLLLCYYYHPSREVASRRVGAYARTLAANGHAVTVVSSFGEAPLLRGAELSPGVRALPVPTPPRVLTPWLVKLKSLVTGRKSAAAADAGAGAVAGAATSPTAASPASGGGLVQSLSTRILKALDVIDAFKRWSLHAVDAALADAREFPVQAVIASGPQFSGVIAAWRIARKLRVPFVADFRDPLAAGSHGIVKLSWLGLRARRHFESRMVSYASAITTASPGIAAALAAAYPAHAAKIQVVLNGFDGEPLAPVNQTDHRLNILFAGILYTNRDPFPFLEALERLLARPGVDPARIKVRFVGNCETYRGQSLPDWLRNRRAAKVVELVSEVSPDELKPFIQESTVLLNFAQGQRGLIPAKTFEHLASGRELLAVCEADSDTGRLLDSVRGSVRLNPGDQAAMDAALVDLYQRHGVEGVARVPSPEDVRRYSRNGQNQMFMRVVSSIACTADVTAPIQGA